MNRQIDLLKITALLRHNPVLALLGPRQCGKTTLARMYAEQGSKRRQVHFFDLEDPRDVARLESPMLALEPLRGLVVIDEIQRRPELFPMIRVLVDQRAVGRRFLILGSASRDLIRQSSETLAGRIALMELTPFSLLEVDSTDRLWLRGGFPRSFLAKSESASAQWRKDYISTFLERDIPNLGISIPAPAMRRFWMMLAHYHSQTWNASEIGRSLGASDHTVKNYLDILKATFMIRALQPWHENLGKRQVKAPKIYFRDSGIFHSLMGMDSWAQLMTNPKLGASWEGFALEQVTSALDTVPEECFFWGTHNQAELDLLVMKKGKRLGFEFKYSDAPKITPSMKSMLKDLKLDELTVIVPGDLEYKAAPGIRVRGLERIKAAR